MKYVNRSFSSEKDTSVQLCRRTQTEINSKPFYLDFQINLKQITSVNYACHFTFKQDYI